MLKVGGSKGGKSTHPQVLFQHAERILMRKSLHLSGTNIADPFCRGRLAMFKIKRIVCPTDLSPEADEALRYALALAKTYQAKLILLYCRQIGSIPDWVNGYRAPELFQRSLFSRLDADELRKLDWTGVVCGGDNVGLTISQEAETQKADLIVMRSRRRPHAAALFGSTAETVCRHAPCPVLVTHPNKVEGVGLSTQELDLHRVLIAHDLASDSQLAVEYGCSLAEEYQAEVYLLQVLDVAGHFDLELPLFASSSDSTYMFVASKLQKAVPKETFLGCNVTTSVRRGKAAEEVLAYAKEHEIDLICMGASCSLLSVRRLFGSTVDRILRQSSCPVLVVRPIKYVDFEARPQLGNQGAFSQGARSPT